MRTKAHSKNRFVRIITLPIRALGKARDYYVRGITSCADKVGHTASGTMGIPNAQFSSLPRSYSSSSSWSNENEDLRELIRAASARSAGTRMNTDMLVQHQYLLRQNEQVRRSRETVPRSCSVGMGKIDEEKPLDDEEEEEDSAVNGRRKNLVYPRSKSHAVVVSRRSVVN